MLMTQIQVLDLKPAPRLEPVEGKSKQQVKQSKHRAVLRPVERVCNTGSRAAEGCRVGQYMTRSRESAPLGSAPLRSRRSALPICHRSLRSLES
jgi:hypothetical protein